MESNASRRSFALPAWAHWAVLSPPIALGLLAAALAFPLGTLLGVACGVALIAAVVSAVHHAEVVAQRIGEPFGTLVLAVSIAVIEVALIVTLMLSGGPSKAELARDTVFATVMLICNGVIGICLLLGGLKHREQLFRIEGAGPAFAALVALSTLVLVLPVVTTSAPEGSYTVSQLVFVGSASLVLWCVFVFFQTIRHRDYFLPANDPSNPDAHAAPPSTAGAIASFVLLLLSLLAVVGLAKVLTPIIEAAVEAIGAPPAVVGIAVAMLVLAPETVAAISAALRDRLQTSMNLAFGSALATIGLTVPAVVLVSIVFEVPIVLGLAPKDIAMLALTFVVGTIALGSGRTNIMQGAVQLAIFGAFMFLAFVP